MTLRAYRGIVSTCVAIGLWGCGDSSISKGGTGDAAVGFSDVGTGGTTDLGVTGGAGGGTGGSTGGSTGGAGGAGGGSAGGTSDSGSTGGTTGDGGPLGGKPETGGFDGGAVGGQPAGDGTVATGGTTPVDLGSGGAVLTDGALPQDGAQGEGGFLLDGSIAGGGSVVFPDAVAVGGIPVPADAGPVESDAGAPVGPAPNTRGQLFFREALNSHDPGFDDAPAKDMQVYFRDYSILPTDAAPSQTAGPCGFYSVRDLGDGGLFSAIDAGPITLTGGPQDLVFSYDPGLQEYSSLPVPDDFLYVWNAGALLDLTGVGSPTIGGFSRDMVPPLDMVGVSPDLNGALQRGGSTVTWAPGNGDTIRITLRAPRSTDQVICETTDTGSLDIPAAVFAWFPAAAATLNLDVTRIRLREFDTNAPVARGTITLEAARGYEGIPLQ